MTFNVATNPPPPLEDTGKWDRVKRMLNLDKKPDMVVIKYACIIFNLKSKVFY